MKICRVTDGRTVRFAVQSDAGLRAIEGDDWASIDVESDRGPISAGTVRVLAPVMPGKIIAVGRNYAEHAKELGNEVPAEPIIFLKPPSALLDPDEAIVMPPSSQRVDFEGELAIVIGRKGRRIAPDDWRSYVAGFTCANDVTARDLQKRDVQFTRGKGFDTFCPLGPYVVTDAEVDDSRLVTRVNGEIRQNSRTSNMIFPPSHLLAFISEVMTLLPGDVILTGTPQGVGPLGDGDVVEVEIEGIGILRNRVMRLVD